jgi:hypothetical protein
MSISKGPHAWGMRHAAWGRQTPDATPRYTEIHRDTRFLCVGRIRHNIARVTSKEFVAQASWWSKTKKYSPESLPEYAKPKKPYIYTCCALGSFSICHELEIAEILIFSRHIKKKVKIRCVRSFARKFQASLSLIFFDFLEILYVCKDLVVQ